MERKRLYRLIYSAVCLTLCLILPFITGQIPEIGSMLCPMHIPVLICGFVCGPLYGAITGALAPLMRSLLLGMPPLFPVALAMCFELMAYGFLSGWLYAHLPNKRWRVYVSLIAAMLGGRVLWGIVRLLFSGLTGTAFTFAMFIAGAFANALPGIIVHIVLIPPIVMILKKQ